MGIFPVNQFGRKLTPAPSLFDPLTELATAPLSIVRSKRLKGDVFFGLRRAQKCLPTKFCLKFSFGFVVGKWLL